MKPTRTIAVLGDFFLWDDLDNVKDAEENLKFLRMLKDQGAYLILVSRRVANFKTLISLRHDLDFDYHNVFDTVHEELGFPRADGFVGNLPNKEFLKVATRPAEAPFVLASTSKTPEPTNEQQQERRATGAEGRDPALPVVEGAPEDGDRGPVADDAGGTGGPHQPDGEGLPRPKRRGR